MNVFASECSSGCESGWTAYLEHSDYLSHIPSASRSRDMNGKRKSDFCDIQVDEEPDDEEEDQSMVSDASSGPPHFNENEVHFDENNNNNNNGCSYPPQISKDAENLKIGGKRKQRNNIKGKGRRSCGDQQQQQSFLDDTASSPVFNYSKNNFIGSNNQASGSSVLDYSQDFSSTHFRFLQGRSAYQDLQFGFLQSSNPSGNNQWFQG
ncbi:unnamed protein product [Malus baccata var. baccata]